MQDRGRAADPRAGRDPVTGAELDEREIADGDGERPSVQDAALAPSSPTFGRLHGTSLAAITVSNHTGPFASVIQMLRGNNRPSSS